MFLFICVEVYTLPLFKVIYYSSIVAYVQILKMICNHSQHLYQLVYSRLSENFVPIFDLERLLD